MNARVTPALSSSSARFFVVFLALTVWAFWPSYFARLFDQPSIWFHAHGIVLALWLGMLVAQAQRRPRAQRARAAEAIRTSSVR